MKSKKLAGIISLLCAGAMCAATLTACTDRDSDSQAAPAETGSQQEDSEAEEKAPDESKPDDKETTPDEVTPVSTTSDNEDDSFTPAMWTVTSEKGNTITMLGSVHALTENEYPLPDKIAEAYENADILVIEALTNGTDSITYQAKLLASMYYDDAADRLSNHISEEAYEILDDYLQSYDMNAAVFDLMKPWAVYLNIQSLQILNSGLSTDYGYDYYFEDQAEESGKEIYAIETADEQIDVLKNLPDEVYDVLFKAEKGSDKDTDAEMYQAIYKAWRTGDFEAVAEESTGEEVDLTEEEEALVNEYNSKMLSERNVGMAEAVEELLEGDKDQIFMIVGAAHFAGDEGIIALLEKDGYTVERVEY